VTRSVALQCTQPRMLRVAQPGEVLVSNTVFDLLAGSGLVFQDRGEFELEVWRDAEAWQP
jgi:hypothetical protein